VITEPGTPLQLATSAPSTAYPAWASRAPTPSTGLAAVNAQVPIVRHHRRSTSNPSV
jgi:hypothetical protein